MSARALLLAALCLGCADTLDEPADPGGPAQDEDVDPSVFGPGSMAQKSGNLRTVGDLARAWTCSTAPSRALDVQIAREVACMAPGAFLPVGASDGVALGEGALPFLQANAAKALAQVATRLGRSITINSGWRSLAQQYLVKYWEGSCGVRVAAQPGLSQHQSGLAVDTSEYTSSTVRKALRDAGFLWYCDRVNGGHLSSCQDPVQFDMRTGDDLRSLSVLAFQKLWNRNHPEDRLAEDGSWGGETRKRLDRAPLAGFAVQATCDVLGDAAPTPPVEAAPGCGTFADVPADHPAWREIEAAHTAGFFDGCTTSPARFCPDDPMSRGQIAVVLAQAMGLTFKPVRGVFADLAPGHWAAEAAEALYDAGITQGCGGGRFCPEDSVSRAEVAVLVARALGLDPVSAAGLFGDVAADHWAAGEIEALARAGIANGCAEKSFCPDRFAARSEVASFFARGWSLELPDRCE